MGVLILGKYYDLIIKTIEVISIAVIPKILIYESRGLTQYMVF